MTGRAGDAPRSHGLWEGSTLKEAAEHSSRDTPGKWGSIQNLCVGVAGRSSLLTKGCFSLLTCAASKLDGQCSVGDALTETFTADTRIVQNIKINIVSLQQTQTVTENAYIET